jgi:hypothetical protein
MTKHTTSEARIFLTDYASYNEGTQFEFGHWVDLSQFSDASELMEYISNHFAEADKKSPLPYGATREEIMITDFEGFPRDMYSESMGEDDFEKVYKYIELSEEYDFDSIEDKIRLHNEYCSENDYMDDYIYENDEDFLNEHFSSPDKAVRAAIYGDYRYMDNYVVFNGYANLESFDEYGADKHLMLDEAIAWKLENM